MAVNLIEQFGRSRTREVLESSFAQFQADRAVVDLARKVRTQQESRSTATHAAWQCHLGDFGEYSTIRRELSDLEKQGARPADAQSRAERDKRQRHLADLRRRLRQHPCHACPEREQHARWAERWWQAQEADRPAVGADPQPHRRGRQGLRPGHRRAARPSATSSATADGATSSRSTSPTGRTLSASTATATCSSPSACAAALGRPRRAARRRHGRAPSSTSPAATRASCSERFLPARRVPRRRSTSTQELWAELDDLEHEHRLPGSNPLATGPRAGHAPLGARRAPRLGARRRRPRRGRLRALDEADHRPARPAVGRGRPARSARPPARRSTPSGAASSPTRRSDRARRPRRPRGRRRGARPASQPRPR